MTSREFLVWLVGFISASSIVTPLVLDAYWGNWGKAGGAGVLLVLGILFTVISLIGLHEGK